MCILRIAYSTPSESNVFWTFAGYKYQNPTGKYDKMHVIFHVSFSICFILLFFIFNPLRLVIAFGYICYRLSCRRLLPFKPEGMKFTFALLRLSISTCYFVGFNFINWRIVGFEKYTDI